LPVGRGLEGAALRLRGRLLDHFGADAAESEYAGVVVGGTIIWRKKCVRTGAVELETAYAVLDRSH
jgi:hypothetical protein